MKIIKGLHNLKPQSKGSVVTVGVFDGVHAGHRLIIRAAVMEARRMGLKSVAITFDPHPSKVLSPRRNVPALISPEHRIRLIEALGIDILLLVKFTEAFAGMSPEKFVENILVDKFKMKEICVGENFYFGRGGRAGMAALRSMARRRGFSVRIIKPLKSSGRVISSSRIRSLITAGKLRAASRILGRGVSVFGTVIKGARLARELGYPTANLNPHHEVIPPSGVYAVTVKISGRFYGGVLNIGVRPTFYAPRDRETAIEVHLFGFRSDIYGRDVEVYFIKKIRDEIRFKSGRLLIEKIKNDAGRAKRILLSNKILYN